MSILEHTSYRTFLKSEIASRALRNSRYSMRSMARTLGIAPSFLSSVLRGSKNLSVSSALVVARKLGLDKTESEYFCLLVQKESAKDVAYKEVLLHQLNEKNPKHEVKDLEVDAFRLISEWYHFAILASTSLSEFTTTAPSLARILGLSLMEVELALERLVRLGLFEKQTDGSYRKLVENPRVVSSQPDVGLRSFHRQTLQKAIESLESQSPQQKVIGSETLAIDSSQIEEFRALADKFFESVIAMANRAKNKNQVYHLGVQFFSFTPLLSIQQAPARKRSPDRRLKTKHQEKELS